MSRGRWASATRPRATRLTLRTQLLWVLGLAAALPVLVFGAVQAGAWSEAESARAERETALAAHAVARELGRALDAHANVVRAMAAELAEPGKLSEPALSQTLARYRREFPGFYVTLAIRPDGVTIMADPPTGSDGRPIAGTSYRDRAYFQRLLRGLELSVSDTLTSRATGRPAVIMVAPVHDRNGKLIAVASAGVDLEIVEHTIRQVTSAVPNALGVVLDSFGKVVSAGDARLPSLKSLGKHALYLPAPPDGLSPRSGDDGLGVERVGMVARVESRAVNWSVLTALPRATVQERVERAYWTMAVFAIGATLFGIACTVFLSRWLARPVASAAQLVQAIGRGDLRVKPEPPGAWHPQELAELGESVNSTLEHLTELVTQLGKTAMAVHAVTRELRSTSTQMVSDSRGQEQAVRRGSGAVVQMTDSIADVSRNVGTLTSSAGEVRRAILSFDRQIEQIAQHLDTLTHAIGQASGGIERVGQQVDAVSGSTDRLSISVEHTASSLRMLRESIHTVAGGADRSQSLARDAILAAETGTGAVDETIQATREIGENFRAVRAAVQSLAGRSEAIGRVTAVIAEVTRATHVLAINASIIASQAGEHGKMFAVVAERVRLVASETASSTQEISNLVASVQADIEEAVLAVERGQTTVLAGEERSAEAGRRLHLIMDIASHVQRQIQGIADATHKQSERVTNVQGALDEVQRMSERIADAATAQREAREELDAAMRQVRVVGQEVQRSTETQRVESRAMTQAVHAMSERLESIVNAIRAQHDGREHIEGSLNIFNEASLSSVDRALQIERAVTALGERWAELERQLRSFRVE